MKELDQTSQALISVPTTCCPVHLFPAELTCGQLMVQLALSLSTLELIFKHWWLEGFGRCIELWKSNVL